MSPEPGNRAVRHAGDFVTIHLRPVGGRVPQDWLGRLRTHIGRVDRIRGEIVRSHFQKLPLAGSAWRDLPMEDHPEGGWVVTLPLTEVGFFKFKAYALAPCGTQYWPTGVDAAISVHPSWTRSVNTLYCAFPRMFGRWSKGRVSTYEEHQTQTLKDLDTAGFTVIPPSGTLRDLIAELPHIIDNLGCRMVHLLPVSSVPTTFARFGRFGSPYAVQHLTSIDPALVEFDKRSNGVAQFEELAYAIHARGGRLMLDLVINHTGWGSVEWEEHPEWFLKKADGEFESPGAWDVIWEDLVEMDQRNGALWDYLAEVFLIWCRRGVDGFRCDAGYKVPPNVWQFITSKVRLEFPDTLFLLEGLGGPWTATDACLAEGGMQWAYSELFQNHGGAAIGGYLDHHLRASCTVGTLIHYSETHDNARLASEGGIPGQPATAEGRRWSLFRNRLAALTSIGGGFGFTCGVEWCATEQINVHSSRGLAWGSIGNLVTELAALNRLLLENPCFHGGARLERLSLIGSPIYALYRESEDGLNRCLVLVNMDFLKSNAISLPASVWSGWGGVIQDLLKPGSPEVPSVGSLNSEAERLFTLEPGGVLCLAPTQKIIGISGKELVESRLRADWGYVCWGKVSAEGGPAISWQALAEWIDEDPEAFLAASLASKGTTAESYRPVISWRPSDCTRITSVPPSHWVLVIDTVPFRATLSQTGVQPARHAVSLSTTVGQLVAFAPSDLTGDAVLLLERYGVEQKRVTATLRFLKAGPDLRKPTESVESNTALVLLTNGRGGMARLGVDLGRIQSKYDCLLAANLHATVPVDRHVFAKRMRAWINADGFISPLDAVNLVTFEAGPPAQWRFIANAGDGRRVAIELVADLLEGENSIILRFSRSVIDDKEALYGRPLPENCSVRLVVRVDLEDRNFHNQTEFNHGAEVHFGTHVRPLTVGDGLIDQAPLNGFEFTPGEDRRLSVYVTKGEYHSEVEWSRDIPHSVEVTRGMVGAGDAFSPGWFDIPIGLGERASVIVSAEREPLGKERIDGFISERARLEWLSDFDSDPFTRALSRAARAFVVRRDDAKTVIAGYPWFLDWGRDSLIAARGLIAARMFEEVRGLLVTFGRFEEQGSLPNSIHGENATNRETSDAPLWYGIVVEELAAADPSGADAVYGLSTGDKRGRTLREVLRSIACGYLRGPENGIEVDQASGLVWSPSHFTWMDTNHPAGTPRQGYPVEIQVLWIRLLRQLDRLGETGGQESGESWGDLARRTEKSFLDLFWIEDRGWFSDCLHAEKGKPASGAVADDALRSNALLAVSLDLVTGEKARRLVDACARHLLIPGALRSLAPLPVTPPQPIWRQGQLLNDPSHPYWGGYAGDEDTRRKPAYHNGTGWVWTFPSFCEALVKAHAHAPGAVRAARAYLGGVDRLMSSGCLGQLPEIIDGDAPHTPRGCDAQAWSVTEVLRVWRWLRQEDRL